MELFVVQRDLPVALLVDARREFDTLCATADLKADGVLAIVAGWYLSGPGQSLTIVAAESRDAVLELLAEIGVRHFTITHATPFPGSGGGRRRGR